MTTSKPRHTKAYNWTPLDNKCSKATRNANKRRASKELHRNVKKEAGHE